MTDQHDPNTEIAMQYLIWALEFIGKTGNQKAASHARAALDTLRDGITQSGERNRDSAGSSNG